MALGPSPGLDAPRAAALALRRASRGAGLARDAGDEADAFFFFLSSEEATSGSPASASASASSPASFLPPPLRLLLLPCRPPKTITAPIARALPPLVAEMRLALPASTVEALVAEVARSFDLSGAAWNDKKTTTEATEREKRVVSSLGPAVAGHPPRPPQGLSLERVPALRPAFEEREGVARLSAALRGLGCTLEAFGALLDVAVVAE